MNHLCLAKKHMVNVIQFNLGKYDHIQPIYFGDYVKDLPPTVYYEVIEYKDHIGIAYCLSHRRDWSNSKNWLIKKLDTHECDFEGFFKLISKDSREVLWTCTRFHFELKFVDHDIDYINIQSRGHGIKPGYPKKIKEPFIKYFKDDFSFVNMATDRMQKLLQTMYRLSPVTSWDTWNDWHIIRDFGKRTTGWIRTDPMELFELAKNCLIVRSLK